MSSRRHLGKLRQLQRLQRIEGDLAVIDHAAACADADAAAESERSARTRAATIAGRWYAERGQGRFDPALDRLSATQLVEAEHQLGEQTVIASHAADKREASGAAWRLTDARRRALESVVRDARRDVQRAEDEGRIDLVMTRTLERMRPA